MSLSLQNSLRMSKLNNGIVAYTFFKIYEKFTSFCQVLKETHTKENWYVFCLTVYIADR